MGTPEGGLSSAEPPPRPRAQPEHLTPRQAESVEARKVRKILAMSRAASCVRGQRRQQSSFRSFSAEEGLEGLERSKRVGVVASCATGSIWHDWCASGVCANSKGILSTLTTSASSTTVVLIIVSTVVMRGSKVEGRGWRGEGQILLPPHIAHCFTARDTRRLHCTSAIRETVT